MRERFLELDQWVLMRMTCESTRTDLRELLCIKSTYGCALCCVVLCSALLRCVVLCCVVLCCAALCWCVVLCCAVLCCVVLCCTVLCCVVLCSAVLCCVVMCCAVLYLDAQHRVTATGSVVEFGGGGAAVFQTHFVLLRKFGETIDRHL